MPPRLRLQVFVKAGCANCAETAQLLPTISKNHPSVDVVIVDMDDPEAVIPEVVFAAPTYLLDGQIVSIGNPSLEEIKTVLAGYVIDVC